MPMKWTAEVHETLLASIVGAGFFPCWNSEKCSAIIAAWPKNKGTPPTVSALTQHLDQLRKRHGVPPVTTRRAPASAASTPRQRPSAATFGSAQNGSTKGSNRKSMQASEDEDDEDDEDDEEGVKSAPPSPTPVARRVRQNTIYGQRREATIPSHGLPSASLSPGMNMASPLPSASRGKKRSRDEEPMRIKKEKETITTTDDGEEDGDEELTMAQRAKQVKKMRLEKYRINPADYGLPSVEDGVDEDY